MHAFVQSTYARKRHVGYSVYQEWTSTDGRTHGRLIGFYSLKDYDQDVALYLANLQRDDANNTDS